MKVRRKRFLLASDFDQTLSFNDSGLVLSELLGIQDFPQRVGRLSSQDLVQQGGELAYLLLHDPDFSAVTRAELAAVGARLRLKANIALIPRLLRAIDGFEFFFCVISAAPKEIIDAALDGVLASRYIFGTTFDYDESSGRIGEILHVPAGYGKVSVLERMRHQLEVSESAVGYIGDGRSDIHVMHHVNRHGGYTVAVSESRQVARIAHRTVVSDDAVSALIPIFEEVCGLLPPDIHAMFEREELSIREWDKGRTDWLTIGQLPPAEVETR